MYTYRRLLLDDTHEIYDTLTVSFDMLYDGDNNVLSFKRMRGKSKDSLYVTNTLSISLSLDQFKQFCNDWIQNLKSLTFFQYEDFLNSSGAFVDDIYAKKRDSFACFPETVTTLSTFKWNNILSIKYYYNNNIIISTLKEGKKLLVDNSDNKIYFTKVEVPLSEYYALYYIKKYYLIRKELMAALNDLK